MGVLENVLFHDPKDVIERAVLDCLSANALETAGLANGKRDIQRNYVSHHTFIIL